MGINSHVVPGDLIVVFRDTALYEETNVGIGNYTRRFHDEESCIVLSREIAGSAGGGHMFFVMTEKCDFGWVYNHSFLHVRTQDEA